MQSKEGTGAIAEAQPFCAASKNLRYGIRKHAEAQDKSANAKAGQTGCTPPMCGVPM